jgi:formyltetrahydrofolate deformylase
VSSDAVLLLTCDDHPGIVADIARFIADAGGNIVHAAQHTDRADGTFFQRVQFTTEALLFPPDQIAVRLAPVAERHAMRAEVRFTGQRQRVALCVSKPPHCAADLLTRAHTGDLPIEIVAVLSNHDTLADLVTAFRVPFVHVPLGSDRASQERALFDALEHVRPDLVVLARYMLVLPAWIVERYALRMINIHHSFLPAFMGANPYRQAHDRGVKVIGATAHYVTAELDEGPIIEQDVARVSHRDDIAELARRGRDVEVAVLARAVRAHVEHRVIVAGRRTVVFD